MNTLYRIFILLFFFSPVSYGQILKGKITNQAGTPIQYATVYIAELKQGTTTNAKGDYEIRLPAGKYTVAYQNLGYQPVYADITISDKTIIKNIALPVQYYEIPEVRITASGEDPAYIIMRKVIGMASYYQNNISSYKAEVYLKGNLLIKRIPRLLQKSMKMEASRNQASASASGSKPEKERIMREGDSFFMESLNEIEFTAPDKYFQRVVSYNSTFPEEGNEISPMDYIEASFYQPVIADMAISPLSPAAFSHYNFHFLGATLQGNYTIDKISVTPKRKSQQLFYGNIYIIEDLWCLHSLDLTNDNLAGKIRVQQLYVPVQDEIWMPVSHKFDIYLDIIGFKAELGYGSSVKYSSVKPNLALERPKSISTDFRGTATVPQPAGDSTGSKRKQQIDKILAKDELTNRDMAKLNKLIGKASKENLPDSIKKNLEIIDNTTQTVEKGASKKDSAYWAAIRPIPLSDIELKSIKQSDSIKAASELKSFRPDSAASPEAGKKRHTGGVISQIITGHTWSDTTGLNFGWGGLLKQGSFSFNTVDGFIYGIDFRLSKSWKDNRSFSIYPDFRWAFSRNELLWRVNANYTFDPLKQQQVYLRAGMTSKDISTGGGINPLLNTAASLLFKANYMKLYGSDYLTLGYKREIVNGLQLDISTTFENRHVLENTTDFSVFSKSKTYSDNTPDNRYLSDSLNQVHALRDQKHLDLTASFRYIPFQKYRMSGGRKIPAGSDWPTFTLTWQHSVNESAESATKNRFDMIRFEARDDRDLGAFSHLRWIVRTGGFFDNRNLAFFDFYHPNAQEIQFLINDYQDAFMLPAYYSLSTPEFYGEAHLKYTTPYLLLKLLPVLSNTLMRENLSISTLASRYSKPYTELGYSISEILFVGEAGVYAGFDGFSYRSIGGKLILRFD